MFHGSGVIADLFHRADVPGGTHPRVNFFCPEQARLFPSIIQYTDAILSVLFSTSVAKTIEFLSDLEP